MNLRTDETPKESRIFAEIKAEEKRWQDEIGNDLIEKSYECAGSRFVYERQFETIIDKIKVGEDYLLLEIGCGRGQFIHRLAETFDAKRAKLFALDLSSGLTELKEKYESGINWIIGDGEELPFPDAVFNIVIYNGSLHHMPNFRKAMQEAFRVMRPDGRLLLFEPISTFFSRMMHRMLDPFVFKKTKYESPVDEYCKDNFRFITLHNIITEAGYQYSKSWHDFLAYPVTGCYAGSYFSRKKGFVMVLAHVENLLHRIPLVRNICNFFCWRLLLDIYRSPAENS